MRGEAANVSDYKPMSVYELRVSLEIIGWSERQLAMKIGCAPNTIRQMVIGQRQTPKPIADYLRSLVQWHKEHPFPTNWRVRADFLTRPAVIRSRQT